VILGKTVGKCENYKQQTLERTILHSSIHTHLTNYVVTPQGFVNHIWT